MIFNLFKKKNVAKKNIDEYSYWQIKKREEGILDNSHFEYFYTELFEIKKEFYKNKKILDIGCGPRGSLEWASMSDERIGLDPLVDQYRELGVSDHDMHYVKAGSENIPFSDNYFDSVFSFNSLDHVDNFKKTVKEIKRVTKSSGIFLLITEFNRQPSVCEPIAFSVDVVKKFEPEFIIQEVRTYIKEGGIYDSVLKREAYPTGGKVRGVLVGKLLKK